MNIICIIIIVILCFNQSLQEELISGNEACVACLSNNIKKVCRSQSTSVGLYCCDKGEASFNCGAGTTGVCSDDIDFSGSTGSEFLMCPNNFECQPTEYYTYLDNISDISTTFVPKEGSCNIEIFNRGQNTDSVRFASLQKRNVDAYVYAQKLDLIHYEYLGELFSGEYTVQQYQKINLIVIPNANVDGGFSTTVTSIGFYDSDANGLPAGAIVGIVMGSLVALLCLFLFIFFCCKRKQIQNDKKRIEKLYADSLARTNDQQVYSQVPVNYQNPNYQQNPGYLAQPTQDCIGIGTQIQPGYPNGNPDERHAMVNQNIRGENQPLLSMGKAVSTMANSADLPSNPAHPVTKGECS